MSSGGPVANSEASWKNPENRNQTVRCAATPLKQTYGVEAGWRPPCPPVEIASEMATAADSSDVVAYVVPIFVYSTPAIMMELGLMVSGNGPREMVHWE
jgi:hypothetical protein